MIIMQTADALARKAHVESHTLTKVIFCHEKEDSVCVQYHPKGIRGTVGTISVSLTSANGWMNRRCYTRT
jgi:hypothetical protein